MNKISKEKMIASKGPCLTMGDLAEFVYNNPQIPRDAKVLVERVEDKYFDGIDISGMSSGEGVLPEGSKSEGWGVVLVEGDNYYYTREFNEKMKVEIELRKEGKGEYSEDLNPEEVIVELTDDLKDQFFRAWCISKENDDSMVYIFNHY